MSDEDGKQAEKERLELINRVYRAAILAETGNMNALREGIACLLGWRQLEVAPDYDSKYGGGLVYVPPVISDAQFYEALPKRGKVPAWYFTPDWPGSWHEAAAWLETVRGMKYSVHVFSINDLGWGCEISLPSVCLPVIPNYGARGKTVPQAVAKAVFMWLDGEHISSAEVQAALCSIGGTQCNQT